MTKKKEELKPVEINPTDNIDTNVYTIRQLRCIQDGSEIKIKDIKRAIENQEIDELWIFSISNKLYKEIISYLKENDIKHIVYGRSRITIYYI